MSKEFIQHKFKSDEVASAEDFNTEYGARLSSLNGGLDRTAIPDNSLSDKLADSGILDIRVVNSIHLPEELQLNKDMFYSAAGTYPDALNGFFSASLRDGQWVTLTEVDMGTLPICSIEVMFSAFANKNTTYDWAGSDEPAFQFRATVNGVAISAPEPRWRAGTTNPSLVASTPASGPTKVAIEFRWTPRGPNVTMASESTHTPWIGSGNLVIIARKA